MYGKPCLLSSILIYIRHNKCSLPVLQEMMMAAVMSENAIHSKIVFLDAIIVII